MSKEVMKNLGVFTGLMYIYSFANWDLNLLLTIGCFNLILLAVFFSPLAKNLKYYRIPVASSVILGITFIYLSYNNRTYDAQVISAFIAVGTVIALIVTSYLYKPE